MSLLLTLQAADGLTIAKVIADVPHDSAAMVLYAMVLASGVLVWRAGRGKS